MMWRTFFEIWGRWQWEAEGGASWEREKEDVMVVERLSAGGWWALEQVGGRRLVPVWAGAGEELPGWARALGAREAGSAAGFAEVVKEAREAGAGVLLVLGGLGEREAAAWLEQAGWQAVVVEPMDVTGEPWESVRRGDWTWEGRATFRVVAARAEVSSGDALRRARLDVGQEAWAGHPAMGQHLGGVVVRALKRRALETVVVDAFQGGRSLRGVVLLGAGWLLAEWLKREVTERRVAVVLPPGLGATLANLGCLLAGKVPVNLNFTAGRQANEKAVALAGVKHVVTAEVFAAKLGDFPWPERRHDLPGVLAGLGKKRVILRALRALVTPTGALVRELGLPEAGGDGEAGLLFTSGSSGDPKGVVLSHCNLLANIAQVQAILPRERIGSILGSLPVFHSFGFTVTLWWPLAGGPRVVTYVSPLETAKLAAVVREHRIALMVTTPTFLRSFLRKAEAEDLRSLELVVTGAEKLPVPLLREFEEKFGVPVCEGYGMTETSPVISTNLTDELVRAGGGRLPGRVVGTVGRPLPGISVRVKHTVTGEDLPLGQSGMLWFKGANVFPGYLNDPERTAAVLREGWYASGDVGRLDEGGFLVIEGRLSRFSKIGGEMVPHGTVEAELLEVLRARGEGDAGLAVVGTRDEVKGEALVVLCNRELPVEEIRRAMAGRGLPNLWIPKIFHQVEAVPVLASGKLDLRACQALAEKLGRGEQATEP